MYFKYILLLTLAVASGTEWSRYVDCTEEDFKCTNGKCILGKLRCNGFPNCPNGTDEINCTSCTENGFRCGNGQCVETIYVCDLFDDCEDGSDENNCTAHVCGSDEFRCQSGQCIYKAGRCNAQTDCADKSDEENCLECDGSLWDSTKSPFKCVSNNKCILPSQLCNSIKDCPDGSDEDPTTCQNLQCAEDEIKCEAGHCVRSDLICRGYDPCGDDHITENIYSNCTECPSDMFKCQTENKCIDKRICCDGVPDCEDGSDESESICQAHKCESNEFQCQSGECLDNRQEDIRHSAPVCNGVYNCRDESDKSDEANCTTCSPEAFKCGSGECVNKLQLCNSIAECSDGSDENEINCPQGTTPQFMTPKWRFSWSTQPSKLTPQHLTKDLAVYFDSSVSPSVTWPFSPLSQAWKYAKKTYDFETLSHEPGSQFLYVVLGKRRYYRDNNFSFRSWKSGYRNIIEPGMRLRNGWDNGNSANYEKLISTLAYIVKIAKEGDMSFPEYKLCSDTLRNIVFYDIYIYLKGAESADVVQYKANQFNRTFGVGQFNCFRDWFLPVYEKFGGATVLNNYFDISKSNWPKNRRGVSEFVNYQSKEMNVGEFVHFWSGAAGEDLRYLAKSAFHNWDGVFMRQFAKAQTDFPNITYSRKIMSGNYRNSVNSIFMAKSSSSYSEGHKSKTKKSH